MMLQVNIIIINFLRILTQKSEQECCWCYVCGYCPSLEMMENLRNNLEKRENILLYLEVVLKNIQWRHLLMCPKCPGTTNIFRIYYIGICKICNFFKSYLIWALPIYFVKWRPWWYGNNLTVTWHLVDEN